METLRAARAGWNKPTLCDLLAGEDFPAHCCLFTTRKRFLSFLLSIAMESDFSSLARILDEYMLRSALDQVVGRFSSWSILEARIEQVNVEIGIWRAAPRHNPMILRRSCRSRIAILPFRSSIETVPTPLKRNRNFHCIVEWVFDKIPKGFHRKCLLGVRLYAPEIAVNGFGLDEGQRRCYHFSHPLGRVLRELWGCLFYFGVYSLHKLLPFLKMGYTFFFYYFFIFRTGTWRNMGPPFMNMRHSYHTFMNV